MRLRMGFFILISITVLAAPLAVLADEKTDKPMYGFVFNNPEILTFDIQLSEEGFQAIQPIQTGAIFGSRQPGQVSTSSMFGMKFNYADATVTCGSETYTGVGIRHRGNASMLMIPPGGKKPYKLDFDRFSDTQSFYGFKKLNFINCFRDPSMMRDKLAYDLMRRVGVPAPHAAYAHLYMTVREKPREYLGLYAVIEQVDKIFLKNGFGNSDGLLIKGEIMNDLEYRGENWENYAHDHELKSNQTKSNTSLFIEFVKFITQASDEEFALKIDGYLNTDRFMRWLAMNTLLSDFDSFAGLGHNWYLYFNTDSKQFEIIPWDANEAFGNLQIDNVPQHTIDFDIFRPYMGDKVLIRRLLAVEKYKALYLGYLVNFTRDVFLPEKMNAEIDRWRDYIEEAVKADPKKIFPGGAFETSIESTVKPLFPILNGGIIGLKPFVADRIASVKAQLIGQKEGHRFNQLNLGIPGVSEEVTESVKPDSSEKPEGITPSTAGGPGEPAVLNVPGGPGGMPPMPPPPPDNEETRAKKKELEAQLATVEAAIKENPNNADLYTQQGMIMAQISEVGNMMDRIKYGMAMGKSFEKALELDPNHAGGHFGRGLVRFFTPDAFGGDKKGAMEDMQFVLDKEPDNIDAHFFMGLMSMQQGMIEQAKIHLEKVLEKVPDHPQAKSMLEQINATQGKQ